MDLLIDGAYGLGLTDLDRQELIHRRSARLHSALFQQTQDATVPMKTTIDKAGRLVIPREVRRQACVQPGMALEVRWRDGRIEIEPAPLAVRLERRGRLVVAVPEGDVPELSTEAVEATRDV